MKMNSLIRRGSLCLFAGLLYTGSSHADLTDGLVSYWPLDNLQGGRAADVVSGMNMDALNLSDADLVQGVAGNAIHFDATKQTMLERIHAADDPLPIHKNENITISFWTRADAQEQFDENGNDTNDRRFFSEGATGNNNPLFNIGTANDGSNNGIDLFIRSTGTATLNHTKSVQEPLDGVDWHHIVWTQVGADSKLYVDGVLDTADFNANAFSPVERFTEDNGTLLNTTSIGGIRRGAPSHWVTGDIDEVGVWSRALSGDEVVELFNNVTPFGGGGGDSGLREGLVSHWPLDEIQGGKAVDVVSGMNMDALNLSEADIVPGKIGNAISFDATKQTMLERIHAEGDPLPIHQNDNLTISFWTNTNAQEQFDENGNDTNDRRFFSEGATGNNNPLFNIGTANDGSNNGIDLFIRSTGTATLNHTKSEQEPLDGLGWHHIVWTQVGAESVLYIDGVADSADFNANAFAPTERFTADNNTLLNTTSIGGIRRGAPSHWITGLIDEVALWNRALSADEVQDLFENGIPEQGGGPLIPLGIEVAAERLTVPRGQSAILIWEGNPDAVFEVDGVGEVETEFGVGRLEVPISEETEFTVTATRGEESVSGSVTVHVRESVVPGWFLLDDFNDWDPGLLAENTKVGRREYWTDPSPNPAGTIKDLDGNNVMTLNQEGEETIFTLLQSQETKDNEARTVYFRMMLSGADDAAAVFHVGLTNKSMRGDGFGGDTNGDLGGWAIVRGGDAGDPGTISVGPSGDPLDLEIIPNTWYKVWLDITNSPGDSDDTISIHMAEENGSRFTLVEDAVGDRGNVINHDRFYVAAKGENTGVESFFIDDIFVSEDGILDTDPLDTDDPNLASRTRGLFSDVDSSGGPFVRTLPIFNVGQTETLTITGAELTGADADLFSFTPPPASLEPGGQGEMTVTFSPGTRTGGVLAFLEISSNDQSNPVVTIDLSAVVPSTNQLIGHYRMDEADGEVLLDSALLRHGTYVAVDGGSFGLGAAGLASGTGVDLGRSGQTGGGYAQARLSGGNLTSFSVSMWIQPDDGEQSSLFAKGEQGGSPTFALLHNGGTVFWFNEDNELTDPVGSIPTGEKSHLVVAYTDRNGAEAGADNLRIYIDGAEVLNQDDPPATVDTARNPLLIGSYFGTLSFDGIIDDVQVYAKAVTAEDAAFLFANPGEPLGDNPLLDSDDDGLTDTEERELGTNPANPDTDGDRVLDGVEVAAGSDPLLSDTDGDGLTDGDEAALGTDPTVADTDGDGVGDGAEVAFGSDPNDGGSTAVGAAFTGFEHAPVGATSFAYNGVEVGWDGTSTGDVGVVGGLIVNDEEVILANQQLMVHNGSLDVTTDPVAIDSPADAVVSIDVRVFQNSAGIENNDFIDLCVLTSTDGTNFDNEICFLSVEGTDGGPSEENPRDPLEDVFETDPAEAPADGEFVNISTNAGDIPAGTTHVKLKITTMNNSGSEYFFFDNIAFKGSSGEVDADPVVDPPVGDQYYEQDFEGFADGTTDLGDGSTIASNDGTNSVQGGVLRMTAAGTNSTAASFVLPDFDASGGWTATFDFTIEHTGENTPADGFSFNYGAIPEGDNFGNPAEEGYGDATQHVSYQVDTWLWNDAAGQDAGVGIELTGTELVLTKAADDDANFKPNERVSGSARISWDPVNGASFTTTGLRTNADFANIATDGFAPDASYGFSILARTGGHNETLEIDNLVVGPFDGGGVGVDRAALGAVAISSGPQTEPGLVDFGDLTGDSTYEFFFNANKGGASTAITGNDAWAIKLDQWNEQGIIGTTQFGVADNLFTALDGQSVASVFGEDVHLVVVNDVTAGETRLYINGTPVGVWAGNIELAGIVNLMAARVENPVDAMGDGSVMYGWATYNNVVADADIVALSGTPFPEGGGDRPFTLENVGISAGGAFTLTIPEGETADIEYSTDLINWEVIATGVTGTVEETDAGRLAAPEGYYRAK